MAGVVRLRVTCHLVHLVTVELRPNPLEWLLFGRNAEERFATRGRDGLWIWDVGGARVSEDVERAIYRAMGRAVESGAVL